MFSQPDQRCSLRLGLCGVLAGALAALSVAEAAAEYRPLPRKKLIQTGWDMPSPRQVREHLSEMEKQPFDGVVINLSPVFQSAHENRAWSRDDLREPVADLKACRFRRFTDNFIMLNANPGNVDWFDDAGWSQIVEHWRLAAWAAREAGVKGILFDPEPYAPPFAQFHHAAQPQRGKHSFSQYAEQARRRGREVMHAVAGEYPDITIFSYFLLSYAAPPWGRGQAGGQGSSPDPSLLLAGQSYGLLPAFLDGWLDVVPPTATLVDGDERAYRYNDRATFLEAALQIKGPFQALVSWENRSRYRAQVQAGFGLYLDAYVNPPSSPWYIDAKGGPRTQRLAENVAAALDAADEYVWIYGEKGRWWPTGRSEFKTWAELLPACDAILEQARDPLAAARAQIERLQQGGRLDNLLQNADFRSGPADAAVGGPPAEWAAWQHESSHGRFEWDAAVGEGSARITGAGNGCYVQSCPAKPGERFFVAARVRRRGPTEPTLRVRWQTSDQKWTAEDRDVVLYRPSASTEDWLEIAGVAIVPDSAGKLVVLLGVTGEGGPEEVVWFDAVRLHRLP